jgi:3-dehydroquinate dehydratase-2
MAGPKQNGTAAKATPRAKAAAKSVLVLHGPNLNLLGTRELQIYGRDTLANINTRLVAQARTASVALSAFQCNHEGAQVDPGKAA